MSFRALIGEVVLFVLAAAITPWLVAISISRSQHRA